jgi:hypothetical protein
MLTALSKTGKLKIEISAPNFRLSVDKCCLNKVNLPCRIRISSVSVKPLGIDHGWYSQNNSCTFEGFVHNAPLPH